MLLLCCCSKADGSPACLARPCTEASLTAAPTGLLMPAQPQAAFPSPTAAQGARARQAFGAQLGLSPVFNMRTPEPTAPAACLVWAAATNWLVHLQMNTTVQVSALVADTPDLPTLLVAATLAQAAHPTTATAQGAPQAGRSGCCYLLVHHDAQQLG